MTPIIAAVIGALLIFAAWGIPHLRDRHEPPPIAARKIIPAREQINIQGWARRAYLQDRPTIQQAHGDALRYLWARHPHVLSARPSPASADTWAQIPPAAADHPDLLQPVDPNRRRVTWRGDLP